MTERASADTSAVVHRIEGGDSPDLAALPTAVPAPYADRADYRARMRQYRRRLRRLQRKLYADGGHALLVVVQGMDAAGKNGLIRRVFGGIDPAGLHVWSFRGPDASELREDWLRRYQRRLPVRGEIGVFNRSYYEIALSARVHPEWLAARGDDPAGAEDDGYWSAYYRDIRDFERYLANNRIALVKLMPHISATQQRRRLAARLESRAKQWKLTAADCEDAARWHDFEAAYTDCIRATATPAAPWYVLPGDDKRTARLLAADAVVTALEALALDWPSPDSARAAELAQIEAHLEAGTDERGHRHG